MVSALPYNTGNQVYPWHTGVDVISELPSSNGVVIDERVCFAVAMSLDERPCWLFIAFGSTLLGLLP